MENQPALQMVALQAVSADYTTHITLLNTTMSAGVFKRLVSIVIQSGHSVNCELWHCTIEPEEEVRQLQVEMENQPALQMLWRCTIEPEEEVRQLQVEMENQPALQMVALQAVSADYTTHITLHDTTMSAGVFKRLVSIVIQSGHSVDCKLLRCTIEPEEESGHSVNCELWDCTIEPEEEVRQLQVEMENQPALQMVALQAVSADYTTHITLLDTTMSAGVFKRLVSIVIQSGHSVNCKLWRCTIEPEEEVRQLQVEMENQPALQMVALQAVSADYTTHITLHDTTMSAGVFKRLVSIVIQSGHSVNCKLWRCTIEPEEEVRQLQVEMENHPAVKLLTPFRLDVRNSWSIEFNVNVKGL
ncbi:hypothetical protein MAR_033642 [Mya arenaria]|uniref:Uncharacterized protein n=1 Tax=Mya arenaria TaxID=6604 RepID=A0ABY7G9L9_MYAAR|nr:hypothetical protein MAR_033642 [Mya arenaria]